MELRCASCQGPKAIGGGAIRNGLSGAVGDCARAPFAPSKKSRVAATIVAFLITVKLVPGQVALSLDKEFEVALGSVGLSAETARFDPVILPLFRESKFPLLLFETCFADPWRTPWLMATYRRQLGVLAGKPHDTLATTMRLAGFGTRRSLLGNPIEGATEAAKQEGSLSRELNRLRSDGLIKGPIPEVKDVPSEVQQAAALLLRVARDTIPLRREALASLGTVGDLYASAYATFAQTNDPQAVRDRIRILGEIDLKLLGAAAHDLTAAAVTAQSWVNAVSPTQTYDLRIETTWGVIRLSGGKPTRHAGEPTLLSIDTGGDDIYLSPASNRSATNWLSICIDTAGDDKYLSDAALEATAVAAWQGRRAAASEPGPAAALCGVAILADSQGNDLYRSAAPGLASATCGVAVLLDANGDDTYDAYRDGIGFAHAGAALLEDLRGADTYSGFSQVQGVGLTRGVGCLVDREGKDRYVANDEVIDFASPQSAEHNVSMAQGAAYGRRGDYLDGHSMSGGIGLLYDMAGDDAYSCGVFGQGVGYWEGIGMLWDDAGNDRYFGQWYVQGASAHFGIGLLMDQAGDDTFMAKMNMAQGAGHDFGYGMLLDLAGNDRYEAPNLSLGAGNANGIGIFVDVSGDDAYQALGITLGRAAEAPKGTPRERALCLGVFMDLAGTDTYPASANWAANGARATNITDRGPTPAQSQLGVFWDR